LAQKFNTRIQEIHTEKSQVSTNIESLEQMEKALMEQLSRTTQKREEKMKIIREINTNLK